MSLKKIFAICTSLAAAILLVACGGGNETASTGTPVVAQATIAATAAACNASITYGNELYWATPLLTATTNPTLEACIAAMPGIAYGNPWYPWQNGGCLESPSMRFFMNGYVGSGANLSQSAVNFCVNYVGTCCSDSSFCTVANGYGPAGSQEALSQYCGSNPS
jgi:hypothetical protein